MSEGKRVVAGEAILSGVATIERNEVRAWPRLKATTTCSNTWFASTPAWSTASRMPSCAAITTLKTPPRKRSCACCATARNSRRWKIPRRGWRESRGASRSTVAGSRGRTREIPLEDPEKPIAEVASSDTPADRTIQCTQLSAALEKLIEALPEKLRQPLILSTIEEMSPREVAATLGINEAAVRSRVFRARQILREKLTLRLGRCR